MPPRKVKEFNNKGRFLKLNLEDPDHRAQFNSFSAPTKCLYIGLWISSNSERNFLAAMRLFRPNKSMTTNNVAHRVSRIQNGTLNKEYAYDLIRFLPTDYNNGIFSRSGERLIEVASRADAKHHSIMSKRMLKKVLDDLYYHNAMRDKAGKSRLTVVPTDSDIGLKILNRGYHDDKKSTRLATMKMLANHSATKDHVSTLFNRYHYHNGEHRHLSNIALKMYKNKNAHNFIRGHTSRPSTSKKSLESNFFKLLSMTNWNHNNRRSNGPIVSVYTTNEAQTSQSRPRYQGVNVNMKPAPLTGLKRGGSNEPSSSTRSTVSYG